jgi:ubiquinone biosynthesis monooxygenase Coq7
MSQNKKETIEQMIRVNHAGEFGAKRIYEGQLAILKNKEAVKIVQHMKEQELKHLSYFEGELAKRKIRPTAFAPIWNVAGFALGAVTALMGEKAAYACTVAVEEVIEDHYQGQLDVISNDESELKASIAQFKQEETEHKDTSLKNDAEQAAGYEILTALVKAGSRGAIWLSKRI